jgi:hypothetical protein
VRMRGAYAVVVVGVQDPALLLRYCLVTRRSRHQRPIISRQSRIQSWRRRDDVRIHVDVVRTKVERNERLEQQGELWVRAREEAQQARRRAPIPPRQLEYRGGGEGSSPVCDHVEYRAQLARLAQCARRLPVHCVQEARNHVGYRAEFGMRAHVGQGSCRQNDTRVACERGRPAREDRS